MSKMRNEVYERFVTGLRRKAVTTCSKWAERYRIMSGDYPGPWTFTYHPWLRGMHDSNDELNIGQKSAQMGYTEWALNTVFYKIDIENRNCLYVLPSRTPDASDFSASRFDPAVELSDHLSSLFSDVKNVGLKRAGTANLYIRGSRSRAGLKSVPVSFLALDELDEMTPENVPLAMERTSGQRVRQTLMISTPTIENYGINEYYSRSSQEHFFFPCPHCSRSIELFFPDCLVITADHINDPRINETYICCPLCKHMIDQSTKHLAMCEGEWVASHGNGEGRGFYINQLYSPSIRPYNLAISYFKAQTNKGDEKEFYNSKMGLPHTSEGARVTDEDIERLINHHTSPCDPTPGRLVTMGADVGKQIHWVVTEWTRGRVESHAKLIGYGAARNFTELELVKQKFKVKSYVVDAQPERRAAAQFANRGHGKICFYTDNNSGRVINVPRDNDYTEPAISVDRTSWMDAVCGRIKGNFMSFPSNINREFRAHMKAPARVWENDQFGNPRGYYVTPNNTADHYFHAMVYNELAFAVFQADQSTNITKDPF